MGRHSKPGPGESFGEPAEPSDSSASSTGRFAQQPDEPSYDGYEPLDDRYQADDEPGYRDEEYDGDYGTDYGSEYGEARADAPTPPPATGGRRRSGWEGGHRSEGGRRGVSIGVIAALITVVVVVGAVILWRFFGGVLSHRSTEAAKQCLAGSANVPVLVDPSIADNVKKFAEGYNANASPVGDRCVKVVVTTADSDAVINGFVNQWPADLGERPALWIPASSVSAARLQATAGKDVVSDSRSLVTSPVLLAVRPALKTALDQQGWGALPGLQTNPTALDGLDLPGWGSLRLALPAAGDADATYLVAEAVASAAAPPQAPATAGLGAVNTLIGGQPKLATNSADEAWKALLANGDPAAAPVHAVATTEQQLFARAASVQDAKNTVAGFLPPGPVAVADYPTVLLAGNWLAEEQVSAASEFARYMRKPEQLAELAKAGFRAEGTTPPGNDVVPFGQLGAPLNVGDESVRATLAAALSAPANGAATTIMLDQSMSADEGGKSRLANVIAAIDGRLGALPGNAAVGLWTFNGVEGRSAVAIGPLSDQLDGQARSAVLTDTLNGLSSSGSGAVSFTTLRLVYGDAVTNFRQGQANSVLVITQGPHTDQSLDGPGLQEYIKSAVDPARPVAVNVIDLGDDPDRATWEAVAQISGGSYQNVATSNSPDLIAAVSQLLS
ncbi:hypothetical protein MANY_15280 [Mycolicibacterium anyangense]|uniref:VWFA domain-containing protein n=1 Tax=Mycolicibacterium anyangense TaxID=1431246 RepID=A0A6N4WAF1_9MYCO|nr:substrate-binding domain-containing protein [Mycolicibacterium anyangense]BBZ76191.1 hypothetical protein MANY_15280 [Mycolicibacterium anyangense]